MNRLSGPLLVLTLLFILLGTAMRPGEVLALRPCDIEDLRFPPDRRGIDNED